MQGGVSGPRWVAAGGEQKVRRAGKEQLGRGCRECGKGACAKGTARKQWHDHGHKWKDSVTITGTSGKTEKYGKTRAQMAK